MPGHLLQVMHAKEKPMHALKKSDQFFFDIHYIHYQLCFSSYLILTSSIDGAFVRELQLMVFRKSEDRSMSWQHHWSSLASGQFFSSFFSHSSLLMLLTGSTAEVIDLLRPTWLLLFSNDEVMLSPLFFLIFKLQISFAFPL